MKPKAFAALKDPSLSTAHEITKPKWQPSVSLYSVGFVTVLKLTEPLPADPQAGPEEGPEESPEENPAETKLDSEDWLRPSPGSPLPESGEVWVNGEDNDHAVSLAEVTAVDPSFEEKRKHILVACLRGESNFDYDGLSPLGAHCCKQLVIWLHTSDRKQWDLEGADLGGANLAGLDLRGWRLQYLNLRGADLGGANLEDSVQLGTDLRGANLGGANLRGVKLEGANLGGANLGGADLRGVKPEGANLRGANLGGADLTSSRLAGVSLRGADLTGVTIAASETEHLSEDQRKQVTFVS